MLEVLLTHPVSAQCSAKNDMVKIGPRFVPRRRSNPQAPPPKLALLIGIDYVDAPADSEYSPLRRARSDTRDFRDLLISKFVNVFSQTLCPTVVSTV